MFQNNLFSGSMFQKNRLMFQKNWLMFQNVSKRSITGVEISKKSVSILDNYDTLMDKTTIQKLCKEAFSPDVDLLN